MAKSGARKARTSPDESRRLLIDATVKVLAREGFGGTSARTVATEAGSTNGLIFYHFGSMDGLLAATATEMSERRITRVKEALGGKNASTEWPFRLASAIRDEAHGEEGKAVVELLVGARTSPGLTAPIADAIDRSIQFATDEISAILGENPIVQLIPADLLAELATAAFFGLELFTQGGRDVDIDRLARTAALGFSQLNTLGSPE